MPLVLVEHRSRLGLQVGGDESGGHLFCHLALGTLARTLWCQPSPNFSPVYTRVTHLVPMEFPLFLFVSACRRARFFAGLHGGKKQSGCKPQLVARVFCSR